MGILRLCLETTGMHADQKAARPNGTRCSPVAPAFSLVVPRPMLCSLMLVRLWY